MNSNPAKSTASTPDSEAMNTRWVTKAEAKKLESLGRQLSQLDDKVELLLIKAREIIGFENPQATSCEEWESIRFENMPQDAFMEYAISTRQRWEIEALEAKLKSIKEEL